MTERIIDPLLKYFVETDFNEYLSEQANMTQDLADKVTDNMLSILNQEKLSIETFVMTFVADDYFTEIPELFPDESS